MESNRHKTQKKPLNDIINNENQGEKEKEKREEASDSFKALLEDSAREAYCRPWHRIERGLRLNRFRIFVEDTSKVYPMIKEEKDNMFVFLQKSHDKKLLNTHKIVIYDQEKQRITDIKGLEMKRSPEGQLKWSFNLKKIKPDATRKKKKSDDQAENIT